MTVSQYSDQQKTAALDAYREHGPAEAERLTGIPRKTIASWARRTGTQMDAEAPARLVIAAQIASFSAAEKRARIAEAMLDKLAESLDRLGSDAQANAAESRLIIALSEKSQLLGGGATARTEHDVTDPAARLALVTQLRDAAAKRQAGEGQAS